MWLMICPGLANVSINLQNTLRHNTDGKLLVDSQQPVSRMSQ